MASLKASLELTFVAARVEKQSCNRGYGIDLVALCFQDLLLQLTGQFQPGASMHRGTEISAAPHPHDKVQKVPFGQPEVNCKLRHFRTEECCKVAGFFVDHRDPKI